MENKPQPSMARRLEHEFPELWSVLQIFKTEGAEPKLIDLTLDGVVIRRNGESVP